MNREFLQLAHVFTEKHSPGGWFLSEKLDGMRAFWDGGVTRGIPCRGIPFANVEKHSRFLVEKVSSGLWSRYGQPIAAPEWWLDSLPPMLLDGELYAGRGRFQFVMSTCKDHEASEDWREIKYHVFDSPSLEYWLSDGKINNTNFKKNFKSFGSWFQELPRFPRLTPRMLTTTSFESVQKLLITIMTQNRQWTVHPQIQLPLGHDAAIQEINLQLNRITDLGGEGVMLKKRESKWTPYRTYELLKVKKFLDSEAIVIGYTSGRATDKGSKLLGMMGNMIVQWGSKQFELSGFTDEERHLGCSKAAHFTDEFNMKGCPDEDAREWARKNAGRELPLWAECMTFPRGSKVTFRYRELSDDGIPKEARYWRKRNE